jgi:hypothetical protein
VPWSETVNLTDTEAAYIAGLIDGEGSIMLTRHWIKNRRRYYYNIKVRIFNTNLEALEWVQLKVGGGSLNVVSSYNKRGRFTIRTQKDYYYLDFARRLAVPLLRRILPYLIIKKKRAELILDYHEKTKYKMNFIKKGQPFYGSHPLNRDELKLREEYYLKVRSLS